MKEIRIPLLIMVNLVAGIVFGLWVKSEFPMPSAHWHFQQIFPLVTWFVSFSAFGAELYGRVAISMHNFWGYSGRVGAVLAACGIGYIIGLEFGGLL